MSTVAFLSAEASDQAIARSPMERFARAAGARFEKRSGWNVAVDYGGDRARARRLLTETVAFADRSQLCKLEVHAAPDALARIVAVLGDGAALEPGRATRTPGTWWCPVTPSRMLVLSEPDAPTGAAAVNEAAGGIDARITIVDMTCGLAALALIGPGCRELLARFCAIDVRPAITPVAGFRPGSIARTPGYLLRERQDQLLLLVGWAFGEYFYEVVADAAEHLGGGPVGADALAEHLEPAHA